MPVLPPPVYRNATSLTEDQRLKAKELILMIPYYGESTPPPLPKDLLTIATTCSGMIELNLVSIRGLLRAPSPDALTPFPTSFTNAQIALQNLAHQPTASSTLKHLSLSKMFSKFSKQR
eukprot:4531469-Amphidinium_carterae.1